MALMADKFLAGVQLWILAYLTTLILSVSNGATVGDTDQFLGFFGDDPDGLYLNTDRPATSNGIVTAVRYCYYGRVDLFQQTHISLIALYRPVNESHYERISDTISITRRSYPLLPPIEFLQPADAFLPKFSCNSYRLTSSVQVLEGDIIGACIYNSGNTSQLDMITTKLHAGYQMMFEGADDAKCDTGVLPRVVGDRLQQDPSARILQVSAEIFPDLFSNPAITTAMTTTAMTTTQATPNTTIIIPTEASPSNDSLLASVVGGALLGILILTIMLVIIMIIVMAIVRIRKKHNQDSRSERVLYHGNSSTNLILGDYEADVDSECDTLNFPHPYERAETVFTHAESQLVEYSHLSQSSSSENNYYTTCSSTPLTTAQRFYFTLEGPNCPYDQLLQKNKAEDIYANVEDFHEPARAEMELYAQITSCGIRSIDQNSIQVCGHLGAGQFGNVEEGVWKVDNHRIKVALKTFNHSSTAEDRVKFLQEAAIMAQFKHPNVVCLYGIINNEEPITLVVQLVEKGDLRKHLLSLRPNPGEHPAPSLSKLLLSFSQHVALGMQYLSGKGFVHRDLAARNILVSKDNICKIADFGLSRDLANENYYISHGGKIPVKWTAPEAIHYKKYSTASDVWSYGCLLYEIWSLGYQPFEGVTNVEAVQFLKKGKRLSPPPGCPRAIYYIMIQCWNPTAAERPMFRNICLSLSESEQDMLNIPQEALDTNQFAGVLGSLLEAGERMYGDLKRKYEVHLD